MAMDDEAYSFRIDGYGLWGMGYELGPHNANLDQPIESFGDVWESQKNHYLEDNGRLPVHVIVQCFCGIFGKKAFDIVNCAMFAILIVLLAQLTMSGSTDLRICGIMERLGWSAFVPITVAMLLLSEPKVWYNGVAHSVNYLWSTVACLGAITLSNKNYKDWSTIIKIFLLPLYVLAGWSHECLSLGVAAGFLYKLCADRHKMSKWQVAYIVAFWIGCALLVFAPSNFARMAEETMSGNRLMVPVKMVYHLLPCLVVLGVEAVLLWRKSLFGQAIKGNMFWIVAAVAAMAFVIASGVATRRSVYGAEIFIIVLILKIASGFKFQVSRYGKICAGLLIALFAFILPYQISAGKNYREIDVAIRVQGSRFKVQGCFDSAKYTTDEYGGETIWLPIPRAEIVAPRVLDKYICRFLTEDECRDAEDRGNTAFQEWVFCWKNRVAADKEIKFCH